MAGIVLRWHGKLQWLVQRRHVHVWILRLRIANPSNPEAATLLDREDHLMRPSSWDCQPVSQKLHHEAELLSLLHSRNVTIAIHMTRVEVRSGITMGREGAVTTDSRMRKQLCRSI
jgi:hypothetical protein